MPWDALMRQWAGSFLVQIMAYRLLAPKPSSDIMFTNGHLCPDKQTLVKFESKYKNLFLEKMHLTVSSEKMSAILFLPPCVNAAYLGHHPGVAHTTHNTPPRTYNT